MSLACQYDFNPDSVYITRKKDSARSQNYGDIMNMHRENDLKRGYALP